MEFAIAMGLTSLYYFAGSFVTSSVCHKRTVHEVLFERECEADLVETETSTVKSV